MYLKHRLGLSGNRQDEHRLMVDCHNPPVQLRKLYLRELDYCHRLEERLNRQTEFTRILVHELRTPLTPILAASELILAEQVPEPLKSLALKINTGAHNLDKTIDELLDISKGEIGLLKLNRQMIDPRSLITETADYISPQVCRQNKGLILDLPEKLPAIKADGCRLKQVLLNLLENSLKFTPSGGEIRVSAFEKEKSLIISVSDNGYGISPSRLKMLFEPYCHADEAEGGGIGLGLTLAKIIVELHSGLIWAESKIGKGSTFSFSIPVRTPSKPEKGMLQNKSGVKRGSCFESSYHRR